MKHPLALVAASIVAALSLLGFATVPASADTVAPPAVTSATMNVKQSGSTAQFSAVLATSSQRNAKRMAKSYLKYSAFSKKGLIKQLRYEGFTSAQAKYGVRKAGL